MASGEKTCAYAREERPQFFCKAVPEKFFAKRLLLRGTCGKLYKLVYISYYILLLLPRGSQSPKKGVIP